MKARWPWLSVGTVFVALLTYALPSLAQTLIYDRQAIGNGEVWRFITGHWVHFSVSHLMLDALVLGLTGGLIEVTDRRRLVLLLLFGPLGISVGLLTLQPELTHYGGLSGLATAALVMLALEVRQRSRGFRLIGTAALLLISTKIALEWTTGHLLFATIQTDNIGPCPLSHFLGVVIGFAVSLKAPRISTSERAGSNLPSEPTSVH